MAKKLASITGIPEEVRTFAPSDEVSDSSTLVGIELEIENAVAFKRAARNLAMWRETDERSLRNNGAEYITPPVMGNDIISAMQELRATLAGLKADQRPTTSGRTGLHVHIDFRGESIQALVRFIVTYLVFEKYLFSLCEKGRDENAYCIPLGMCEHVLLDIPKLLSSNEASIRHFLDRYPKYTALNLKPLRRFGSVEVRMHEGTIDPDKILRWVNTLLSIKAYATGVRASPQTLIDKVCAAPEEYYNEVFGTFAEKKFTSEVYEGMLEGARAAQYMYRTKKLSIMLQEEESTVLELYPELKSKKTKKGSKLFAPSDELALRDVAMDFEAAHQRFVRSMTATTGWETTAQMPVAPTAPNPTPRPTRQRG